MIELPAKLQNHIQPEPNTGCWLWLGARSRGYGKVRWDGVTKSTHRIVYAFYKGAIPDGLTIDHLCRVRCCVNPDHMEAVTYEVNTLRSNNPAAINARKFECDYGHSLERAVMRKSWRGKLRRDCLECRRVHNRRSYMRWKEKQ